MQKAEHFNFYMADKHGFVPADHYIDVEGRTARHSGNFKLYTISGFAWMGATDEWGFVHSSPEGVTCVRPMHHLWGKRDDGTLRYTDLHGVPFEPWYAYQEASTPCTQIERLDGPSPKVVASVTYPYDISVVPEHAIARLEREYEDLLAATADLTDAFLQVPDRVSMLVDYGAWVNRWAKPAICKIAKAVGHKARSHECPDG